jgi:KUP system potassium uptake protein
MSTEGTPAHATDAAPAHGSVGALAVAAVGIVYGDIGTSPLYTLKECVSGPHGVSPTPANVLGVLSLIFWSLTMVVTVKYLVFIMRADNRGEGGILALLALLPEKVRAKGPGRIGLLTGLVLVGAALLYGDGVITPAISVLSAMEGLELATTSLKPMVVPITCAVLLGLFLMQKRGTAGIGRLFGPVMVVWFVVLAALGIAQIVRNPAVLAALSPHHGLRFFQDNGWRGFALLGSVVLAVTGGEALYADMGHFGVRPIRAAWVCLVMPALTLSYFGQGALLLRTPAAAAHPFFAQVSSQAATVALVVLSTLATVIASQALISGAFSLTHQAVQLGFFPRVEVKHTSHVAAGQIYIPEINWSLAVACVALVLIFKQSSGLAAAYGIAVSGTMAITSIVYFVVIRTRFAMPLLPAAALLALFLAFDVPFFVANLLKFPHGGYVPVVLAAAFFAVMATWRIGRTLLGDWLASQSPPWETFLGELDRRVVTRIPGASVFLASDPHVVPPCMLQKERLVRVLTEHVIVFSVVFEHAPTVARDERLEVKNMGHGFFAIVARCGFMESPRVPALLEEAIALHAVPVDASQVTYYLGRETFLATDKGRMGRLSESLFAFLSRNSRNATLYFDIPAERVVELGSQIDL